MTDSRFKITSEIAASLKGIVRALAVDRVFVLVDENTSQLCLPKLDIDDLQPCVIEIGDGDEVKCIDTAMKIWDILVEQGASRHSLLVNIGGGVISDLGGFVASTFKRGMRFVNVPTTLLGAVDAASGGKTGINYHGLKNEIGTFSMPEQVLINTDFYITLDFSNRLSGYAEMVKHALIADSILLDQTLAFDVEAFDLQRLSTLLEQNLDVKQRFVEIDPEESGQRKALNFGHTVGHAIESLSHELGRPVLHGYAVMWGMVAELYLSVAKLKLDSAVLTKVTAFAREYFGLFPFSCKEYDRLYELMLHDKKNVSGTINFTLIAGVGDVRINQTATRDEIFEAIDFVREG